MPSRRKSILTKLRRAPWFWAVGAAALVAGIVAGIALVMGDGERAEIESDWPDLEVVRSAPLLSSPLPIPEVNGSDARPESLLWTEQTEDGLILRRTDLRTGRTTDVPGFPSHVGSVAPGGAWALSVEDGGPLMLVEVETGDRVRLGESAGIADLLWSSDGERLAILRSGSRVPAVAVDVVSVDDPMPERVLPAAPWRMLGWGADHLVAYHRTMKQIVFVDPAGGLSRLPAPEGEVAEITPDGRWLLAKPQAKDLLFHEIPTLDPFVLSLQGRVIDTPQWLPDGRALAATAESGEPVAPASMMLIDPFAREFELLPGTDGAVEALTAGGRFYVYASGHTGSWDLHACVFPSDCRRVGELPLGVTLIALQ